MRQTITADFGKVRLGGTELPGVFHSMRVKGSIRMDEVKVPGASGKSKQPLGFEDGEVTITVVLLNDNKSTPYAKLKTLVSLFRRTDDHAKPMVYEMVNKHTEAWGIRRVVFKDITSSEGNSSDTIQADMSFVEYVPVMVQTEQRATATRTPQPGTDKAFATTSQQAGGAAKKTASSPAVDDDRV